MKIQLTIHFFNLLGVFIIKINRNLSKTIQIR